MTAEDELTRRRAAAETAARAAGAVHLRYRGQALDRDVHDGNRADFTTVADLEAQEAVKRTIAEHFPGELVIGEEDLDLRLRIADHLESGCWLTDPLDGTQEYSHGAPGFSCIVGYVRGGVPLAGAVYFAVHGEMFSAAAGQGATLNGAPTRTTGQIRLDGAMFAAQPPPVLPGRAALFHERLQRLLPHIEGLRILGSQSALVCSVAAGHYDMTAPLNPRRELGDLPYFGQPWETPALALIVQEAGGAVSALDGGPADLLGYNLYAATRELIDQFLAAIG